MKTSRQLKRLDSVTRSPIYNHVSQTIAGRPVIKSRQLESVLISRFTRLEDDHSGVYSLFCYTSRWLAFRLEIVVTFMMVLIAVTFVLIVQNEELKSKMNISSGTVGVILSSVAGLLGHIQYGIRQSTETENNLTSVERVLQYAALESEADIIEDKKDEPEKKGNMGEVEFCNVYFSYTPTGTLVLKNLSIKIQSGQKVGVVGRTGAGKSSLIAAIYRVANVSSGKIMVNGTNAATTPLKVWFIS